MGLPGEVLGGLIIAITLLITTTANYIKSRTNRTAIDDIGVKLANELKECKDGRAADQLECQKSNNELKNRLSALETELTFLVKLLPGGEWFKKLGLAENPYASLVPPLSFGQSPPAGESPSAPSPDHGDATKES